MAEITRATDPIQTAQALARQAAATEHKRLATIPSPPIADAQPTETPKLEVDRAAFVDHGTVPGTDAAQRAALFARFDGDASAGLSETEIDGLFALAAGQLALATAVRALPHPTEANQGDYEALATEAQAQGNPDLATVLLAEADPTANPSMKHPLHRALTGDPVDAPAMITRAACAVETAADVETVLAAQRLAGGDEREVLKTIADTQGLRSEMFTGSSPEVLAAVAANYTRLDPAGGASDVDLSHVNLLQAGDAAIEAAMDAHDAALEAVQAPNKTLALAMTQMEGLSADEQQRFITAFQAQHPEYAALEAAQAQVAATVTANADALGDALANPAPLTGLNTETLERALAVAALRPEGQAAAGAIVTQALGNVANLPTERQDVLAAIVPGLVTAQVQNALAAAGGDGAAAMAAVQASPLGQAIAGAQAQPGDLGAYAQDMSQLGAAMAAEDPEAAAALIGNTALRGTPSATAMAAIALVVGGAAFMKSQSFMDAAKSAMDNGSTGAGVTSEVAKMFDWARKAKLPSAFFEKAAGVIGVAANVVSGVRNLANGRYLSAAADGVNVALGVLALAGVPGIGPICLVGTALSMAVGLGVDAYETMQRRDEIRSVMASPAVGLSPGMVDFLTNNPDGAFDTVKTNLGLSDAEMRAIADNPQDPWHTKIAGLAAGMNRDEAFARIAPDGQVMAGLERLTAGLSPDGVEMMRNVLMTMTNASMSANEAVGYHTLDGPFMIEPPTPERLVMEAEVKARLQTAFGNYPYS